MNLEYFRGLPILTEGWALLCEKFADKTFAEGSNTEKFAKVSGQTVLHNVKAAGYTQMWLLSLLTVKYILVCQACC